MGFLDDLAKTKPARDGGGNWFTGGAGTAVLKDFKIFNGNDDPQTVALEFYIKNSQDTGVGTPNPAGTSTDLVEQCRTVKGAMDRVMRYFGAFLGSEFGDATDDSKKAQMTEIFRAGPEGYTKDGTECPLRGIEVRYTTKKKTTGSGKEIVVPRFEYVPFNADTVKANRALLDGKAT